MDGLVLWLDAMDVDGDNFMDQNSDGGSLPLWIDKSKENKNAVQTVALQTPSYVTKAIELYRVYASNWKAKCRQFKPDLRKCTCVYGRPGNWCCHWGNRWTEWLILDKNRVTGWGFTKVKIILQRITLG